MNGSRLLNVPQYRFGVLYVVLLLSVALNHIHCTSRHKACETINGVHSLFAVFSVTIAYQ